MPSNPEHDPNHPLHPTASFYCPPEKDDDLPFFKLRFHHIWQGIKEVANATLSTSFSMICICSLNLISLAFIGTLKDPSMTGGMGLGFVFSNCCAFVLLSGINLGVNVLAAQAFGAGKNSLVSLNYHRGLFALFAILPIIFLLMGFTKQILTLFTIKPDIAHYASEYIFYALPSFIFFAVFDCTKSYLYAQNIFKPILYTQAITTTFHFFWSWFFIIHLKMGPAGAGIAKNIVEFCNMMIIFGYITFTDSCNDTWVPFKKVQWRKLVLQWKGMKVFLKTVIPMSALLFLDMLCFEVFSVIAALLGEDQLAVHVGLANTVTVYYSVPLGISIAVMTFVAHSMGKNKAQAAKNYTYYGLILSLLSTFVFIVILILVREKWADLFGANENIRGLLLQVLNIYFIFILFDGIQVILSGTIKGIEKQNTATIGLFICYYVITLPVILLLVFRMKMKVQGIWFGFLGGIILLMVVYVMILLGTNFKTQAQKIRNNNCNIEEITEDEENEFYM